MYKFEFLESEEGNEKVISKINFIIKLLCGKFYNEKTYYKISDKRKIYIYKIYKIKFYIIMLIYIYIYIYAY